LPDSLANRLFEHETRQRFVAMAEYLRANAHRLTLAEQQ